jgi:hypothetical protein
MAVERCDLSELPVDQCACRIHKPGQETDRPGHLTPEVHKLREYGPPVSAQYGSVCLNCGDRIRFGDEIRAAKTPGGTRWVHDECAEV